MAVRPSVRFEIFKRDQFTCAYCGRRPPDVTLEVDHIIPLAEGGGDERENLVTACMDCNRGKGAVLLDLEPDSMPDLTERADLIREREEQLRAYHEVLQERASRQDAQLQRVLDAWCWIWGGRELYRSQIPGDATLLRYIEALGPDEVIASMTIIADKFHQPNSTAPRYFIGILKNKQARLDGLLVECFVCGKFLRLEPGDDTSLRWRHGDCPEPTDG